MMTFRPFLGGSTTPRTAPRGTSVPRGRTHHRPRRRCHRRRRRGPSRPPIRERRWRIGDRRVAPRQSMHGPPRPLLIRPTPSAPAADPVLLAAVPPPPAGLVIEPADVGLLPDHPAALATLPAHRCDGIDDASSRALEDRQIGASSSLVRKWVSLEHEQISTAN